MFNVFLRQEIYFEVGFWIGENKYLRLAKNAILRILWSVLRSAFPNTNLIFVACMFANISRSKDNKTIKFGQIIECNVRNIFREKSHTKFGGESSPKHFSKKSKLSISQDQESEILYSLFLLYVQVGDYQNKVLITCFYLT